MQWQQGLRRGGARTTPRSMMTRCREGRFLLLLLALPKSSSGLPILAAPPLSSLSEVDTSSRAFAWPSATYHLQGWRAGAMGLLCALTILLKVGHLVS